MPQIKGFKMVNGKIDAETIKKMKDQGLDVGDEGIDMEKMFGKGYKAEKKGDK